MLVKVFIKCLFGLNVFWLALVLIESVEAYDSLKWQSTKAVVTKVGFSSNVKVGYRSVGRRLEGIYETQTIPNLKYKYRVGSDVFTSSRYEFLQSITFAQQEEYKVGQHIDIYFNPSKPSEAVVIPGLEDGLLIKKFILFFGISFGLLLLNYIPASKYTYKREVRHRRRPGARAKKRLREKRLVAANKKR